MFLLFPAVTMLLGWGLRGYIGGGPFGAMIPGAFVALSLSMLLNLSVKDTAMFTVFSAVAIGLGGEMTYGQTLGFLRHLETMWWGTLGTTVKGAVWGLLGGVVVGLGLIFKRIPAKQHFIAYALMMLGMLIGFKLINQPMVIYFSDPAKPRAETWAALLFGAIAMLIYLKVKLENDNFIIISRTALWGLIGGGLGFGLGGFWMVLGSHLPKDAIFLDWWKAMEFTFGLLLGAGLGIAAWFNRNQLTQPDIQPADNRPEVAPFWKDFSIFLVLSLVIFWVIPGLLDDYVDSNYTQGSFTIPGLVDIAKMISNFAFFGLILIAAAIRIPSQRWQIAITMTFCYAAIDYFQDVFPDANTNTPFSIYFLLISLMVFAVGALTAWFQRKENIIRNMFLLLVWACMFVAYLRLFLHPDDLNFSGLSLFRIISGKLFVHLIFTVSAVFISWFAVSKLRDYQK